MKVKVYHNARLIEETDWANGTTPDGVMSWHKRYRNKYGYDVMIGNGCYFIKGCIYVNNDTEIKMKVSKKPQGNK